MNVEKRITRKYYKYEYSDWIQPILTSNGYKGGREFAVSALNTDSRTKPYFVFDNNLSDNYNAGWLSKASNNYLQWYNPNPINITQLNILYQTTSASSVGYITNWIIRASNDGDNFIDIIEGTTGNYGNTVISISHERYYKYWRIYPISWSSEWYAIINMNITAQEQLIVKATEEDYDFYKDELEYYTPIEDKEKYYVQDEYKRLRLYDTTNRSYIDTNNHFIVNSVTAWSTTQIYTLQPNIVANKLRIRVRSDYIQANAGWRCFLIARLKNGSTQSFYKDWGYNVMPNGTYFMDLNTNQEVSHITIYAYCYRSTNSYCYGSINLAIDYSTLVETTKEKANIIKKDKEVIVNAIGAYRKPRQLAEGFLQLEHIQCNGNQYIFTDYYPKLPSTKIRYICEFMNTPDQCLWCARGATTTTLTNTMFKLAGGLRFDYNATTYQTSACRNTQYIYEIVQDGLSLYVDGVLKYTYAASTFNCDSPLQFFASYYAGIGANLGNYAFLKCYLIEIYEDNVLVRRYVPCERVIDKVYGLYDTVNNAFFSNSWSGYNFTRGDYVYEDSDVNDFTIYNPKAYFEATSV